MFRLGLFRIRAFAAGNIAALLTAIARGGLQFMLIIWLQGIWLPLHGYGFEDTPLWAGIYMLPLTVGFLLAGPTSGYLSDRYGARLFATGGLVLVAPSFVGLLALPVDFAYPRFALLLLLNGIGQGMFSAPNTSAIMSSVPPDERGVASGMRVDLPELRHRAVDRRLLLADDRRAGHTAARHAHRRAARPRACRPARAEHVAALPPVSTLFAAFLGNNPIGHLLGDDVLDTLPAAQSRRTHRARVLPGLVSGPFHHGLVIVFSAAAAMAVIAALASFLRGRVEAAYSTPTAPDKEEELVR